MLDRKTPPAFQKSNSFTLITPEKIALPNGLPVTIVRGGEQEVAKIEFIFKAGKWYEPQAGISYFTAHLLERGTSTKKSFQISSEFDQYGVQLHVQPGFDFINLTLYGLTKNIAQLFGLTHELITQPSFPEPELHQAKDVYIQGLKINLEKTSYLSGQLLRKKLFGTGHPYGADAEISGIQKIERDHLVSYHRERLQNFEIICSGMVPEKLVEVLAETFGNVSLYGAKEPVIKSTGTDAHASFLEKENTVQSSVRLGKKIISRTHASYPALLLLNHIFGGFFGSRLMKNIREEKGLTYGIYSSMALLKHDSYLSIGADVNKENRELVIEEIKNELRNLRTERIGSTELEIAKNHFIGSLQSEITTPFAHAEKIRSILMYSLPSDFYQALLTTIDSLNENDLLETAQKYFNEESFTVVAAG